MDLTTHVIVAGDVGSTLKVTLPSTVGNTGFPLFPTLSQFVAALPPPTQYIFGSAAGGAGTIPIKNATDLGNNFNPYADFGGNVITADSLNRWSPYSVPGNYVFASDHLSLTATLDAGGHVTPTVFSQCVGATINLNGGANTIANLGLANTTGIQVGQIMGAIYNGLYVVSAVVANTSVTFLPFKGSRTTPVGYSLTPLIVFYPYYIATVTTPGTITAGNPVACSGGVPAGVVAGMFYSRTPVGATYSLADTPILVTGTTGSSVTLNTTIIVGTGDILFFTPPIRSAQMWTKNHYKGGNSNVVLATELTCQLPHNSAGAQTIQHVTATQYAALPPGGAGGAWAAYWIYSADDGQASYRDASEIDIFEFNNSANLDSTVWSGFTHGNSSAAFLNNNKPFGGGSFFGGGYVGFVTNLSAAVHKFQLVWTNDALYRYIDDILIKAETWRWGSLCPANIAISNQIGSTSTSFGPNLFLPYNDANFPMSIDVYSLKVWTPQ